MATGSFESPSPRGLILEKIHVHQLSLTQRDILLLFFPQLLCCLQLSNFSCIRIKA